MGKNPIYQFIIVTHSRKIDIIKMGGMCYMEKQNNLKVKNYLDRFDEILLFVTIY